MEDEEKYRRAVDLLKEAGRIHDVSQVEREVMTKLYDLENRKSPAVVIYGFLFGWTEIMWVRRSLILASFVLILMFVYQQSVIVRQLNTLSSHIVFDNLRPSSAIQTERLTRLRLIKSSAGRMDEDLLTDEQIQQMIKSYDKLRTEYESLLKIIEADPELKRIFNERLSDMNHEKVKM